jgi:hypothetical protein
MPLLTIPSTIPTSTFYQLALQALYDIAGEGGGSSVVTNSGVFPVQNTTAIPAGTNAIGSVSVSNFPTSTEISNDVGNPVPVSMTSVPSHAVTNAGTFAVQNTAAIPTGSNVIGAVTSNNALIERTASFTRPANTTVYAAGDLVANNVTAGSVTPLTFTTVSRNAGDAVRIERARINTSNALLTNASFRLHLFEGTPVPTVGDNGVFNNSGVLATSGIDGYVGSFEITLSNSGSTGSVGIGIPNVGNAIIATPTSGTSIFGLIEATAAYVPVSGATFTVSIEGYRP